MSISSTNDKNLYNGDGSTTTFAYTFEILENTSILVQLKNTITGVITTQTLTTDYTVSNVGVATGGNVVFVVAPPTGNTIILLRQEPYLQPLQLLEYGPFSSQAINTAFDRVTMLTQQLNEVIGRQVVFDPTLSNTFNTTLPLPTTANAFLGLNSTATGFQFTTLVAGGGIPNVKSDPSPQLGGVLDINGYTFKDSSNINRYFFNGSTANPAQIYLQQKNGSNYVGWGAPNSISANILWTLPAADGTSGQVLSTNGAGGCSWVTRGSGTVTSVIGAGLASGTVTTTGNITVAAAAKTDQQAASSNILAVTPLHQGDHPAAAKAFAKIVGSSGAVVGTSLNIASVTRTAAGQYNISLTTAFSSSDYAITTGLITNNVVLIPIIVASPNTNTVSVNVYNTSGTLTDPTALCVHMDGGQ